MAVHDYEEKVEPLQTEAVLPFGSRGLYNSPHVFRFYFGDGDGGGYDFYSGYFSTGGNFLNAWNFGIASTSLTFLVFPSSCGLAYVRFAHDAQHLFVSP